MAERLEQLQKLYDGDPNDPFLTYGIALEHSKTGAHDVAIEWLDRTLQIDGQYCYAFFQKAKMLDAQGNTDAAKEVLTKGIETAQQAGDAHAAEEMRELINSMD